MHPGDLVSRTFTAKDTHSVQGDLLVVYAELDRVDEPVKERALATTSVLGFNSPSFSFGTDIVLPAEINQQLRDVILTAKQVNNMRKKKRSLNDADPKRDAEAVRGLAGIKNLYVPEVRV